MTSNTNRDSSEEEPALAASEDDPVRESDFESMEFDIRVTSSTSGVVFPESANVKLIQFLDDGLLIQMPTKSCAAGHRLLVDVQGKNSKGELIQLEGTAQVKAIQNLSENADQVTTKMIQFNEEKWKSLIEILSERQKEVTNFLSSAKD